jgi:hypothetical protein
MVGKSVFRFMVLWLQIVICHKDKQKAFQLLVKVKCHFTFPPELVRHRLRKFALLVVQKQR